MSDSPYGLSRVRVVSVAKLSPTYLRVELSSPAVANFGTDHPSYDQRIKLIFPPASGTLPDLDESDDDWYDAWNSAPEDERGSMRTYTLRDVRRDGDSTVVVVDFVLHLKPGATGPASSWAANAKPGDEILIVGPQRGFPPLGIEFEPGDADRILLAGDETAVPAMTRILADLPIDARGAAFLEIPHDADTLDIEAPAGIDVTWLPREGAAVGTSLLPAVVTYLGGVVAANAAEEIAEEIKATAAEEADAEEIWETPTYSGDGEAVPEPDDAVAAGIPGLYAWIAGESSVVTTIRRHLVKDLGVDRTQVAFMGYWREGVAMRG